MGNQEEKKSVLTLAFAALNPYQEKTIVTPTETKVSGKDYVIWGDGNKYADYLAGLYATCTTLRSVINGATDYAAGNDARIYDGRRYVNTRRMTAHELVRALAKDYFRYGGFAIQVIRDHTGKVAELYPLDLKYIRSDKENEVFWYSEKWTTGGGRVDAIRYPKFMQDATDTPASILFYKGDSGTTYPAPLYAAAVSACETERGIDEFNLGQIERGFMGSYIVNFNNGAPVTDEMRKEIEREFEEKFCGAGNAGRVMFSFNPSKDAAATVQKLEIADYGEKYETLSKRCRQAVFTAFRANPNLFGIATESSGFNSEEYDAAFKLFNRTVIRPVQQSIVYALDRIFGVDGSLTIDPFSIDGGQADVQ